MAVEISMESPLAQQLNDAIRPKLLEVGWSTDGEEGALSEYIILMLVNGKTQEQIALELSGDLLNLGPDDPGARDFAQWLFDQVALLQQGENVDAQNGQVLQDSEMGDAAEAPGASMYVFKLISCQHKLTRLSPTGPKNMRNGGSDRGRDRRMMGQLRRNMDQTHDPLRQVRPHVGNERINTHRTPNGPRGGGMNIRGRGGNNMMNNRIPGQAGAPGMSPQQQMEIFAMLEQQAQLIAQMAGGGAPGMPMGFNQQQNQGRSLFDRVQPNRQNGRGRGNHQHQNGRQTQQQATPQTPSSAMDVELTPSHEKPSADTVCKFNLRCSNPDCKFAHQSPAAPPGVAVDVNDVCSFGAACKNRKCTGRHPSPAQKLAHAAEQDCKFYPNCTNPHCAFRHGPPPCRNGADCKDEGCKFTHSKIVCKFNPCLNPKCMFKHEEGQKRGKFEDKVWVAGEHVSDRKFVDENAAVEELHVPGNTADIKMETQAELIA